MAMLVAAGLIYRLLSTGQGTSHHTIQINKEHQQCLLVLIYLQNALLVFITITGKLCELCFISRIPWACAALKSP